MIDTYSVHLSTLVKDFNLQVIHASSDYESIKLTAEDVGRPGLPLKGDLEGKQLMDGDIQEVIDQLQIAENAERLKAEE